MHVYPLLTTLAAGFAAAWALGLITQRIGLSPIVGYLLAGVLIGPYTPGFVADVTLAPQLAELGVMLLMFGVGLHFHLEDLLAVRSIAIPGAIVQSAVATLAGAVVFSLLGLPLSAGVVLGMAMAVASTVVLIRVLEDNNRLASPEGHAAVGWLIVEDIFTVIMLVMLPALAGLGGGEAAEAHGPQLHWALSLALALGKMAVMVVVIWAAGSRIVPWVLIQVARLRSRELFTLTVLVLSIAVATAASVLFGASVALGAFLAGMVVAQSPVSQQAGIEALPMRDAFAVMFFVAVGMLFDPRFIVEHPGLVAAGLGIVLIAKPLAALAIVIILGHPIRTGLTVAVALGQIGEFSFILGEAARSAGLLPEEGTHLLVAAALISITINPILFRFVEPMEKALAARPGLWKLLNRRAARQARAINVPAARKIRESESTLAVIVGYGPVGRQVDRLLRDAGVETVIVDLNMDTVRNLMAEGRLALFGDGSRIELLKEAGIARATHLVLSAPSSADQHVLIEEVRKVNPTLRLIIRTRFARDGEAICSLGPDAVVVDEVEAAAALTELVQSEKDPGGEKVRAEIERLREAFRPGSKGSEASSGGGQAG